MVRLGVLAVIGVLSVAGIAGYSMAMRNHRANEVLNAASMLYVVAMAKNQGTGADTSYATEIGTPPSGTTLSYTASSKSITINFTNEDDCKQAKNKLGDKAPEDCTLADGKYNLNVNFGEVTTVVEAHPEPTGLNEYNECPSGNCCPSGWLTYSEMCASPNMVVTCVKSSEIETLRANCACAFIEGTTHIQCLA